MNFEAKLAGFVYRDGTNVDGWPDCIMVDSGGILVSEYDTRAYYPIDRRALLELADDMDAYTECDDERCGKEMPPSVIHDYARRIREALRVQDG